jgi:hypothetical protein
MNMAAALGNLGAKAILPSLPLAEDVDVALGSRKGNHCLILELRHALKFVASEHHPNGGLWNLARTPLELCLKYCIKRP